MEPDRRDDRIERILEMLAENSTLTKQVHQAMFGNGKPGLKQEFLEHKSEHARIDGQVSVWKWIAGLGIVPGIFAGIKMIVNFFAHKGGV